MEKTCTARVKGSRCNFPVVKHPRPDIKRGDKEHLLCKNPKCDRYYICACGKKFGHH